MKDLCWFYGGPADGRVMELEVCPHVIVPVNRGLNKRWEPGSFDRVNYYLEGEFEDGQVYKVER